MPTITEVFGDSLVPDPSIALPPPQIPVRSRSGPSPRLQFVLEFVGPRTVSAAAAVALLHPDWRAALGDPQTFVMSGADVEWRPMPNATAGSYDSIALAWDLISPKGQLSKKTAQHLVAVAEQFGEHIQRRVMAMPVPEDLSKAISHIKQVQGNFDAGISVLVLPLSGHVAEHELWVWCAKLGLTLNLAHGTFDWIAPSSPLPLLSVSPLNEHEVFTLEGAQRGDTAEGVLLGFNLPRSPEPIAGFSGMIAAANYLAGRMHGQVFDESNKPLNDKAAKTMSAQISAAVDAMTKLGFPPGSPDCLRLFADSV